MRAKKLLEQQAGLCFYCREPLDPDAATVDHIIPRAHGGGGDVRNLAACCQKLNNLFGSMAPKEKMEVVFALGENFTCPCKGSRVIREEIERVQPAQKKRKKRSKRRFYSSRENRTGR